MEAGYWWRVYREKVLYLLYDYPNIKSRTCLTDNGGAVITLLGQTTTHAIMITGFVLMMMLIIEYFNVLSRGVWQRGLRESPWRQYLLASMSPLI